jgi:hypothetical protein
MATIASRGDDRPLHEVKYSTRLSLLALAGREPTGPILFVPTTERIATGTAVRLKVRFGDSSKNFYLGGTVTDAVDTRGSRAGFTLAIQTAADRRAFTHVEAFCSRRQEPARRFQASIPCTLRVRGEKISGRLRDVSMTGAFVTPLGRGAIEDGAAIAIEIKEGWLGLSTRTVKAHVVWRGEKPAGPGFGAEFFDSSQQVLKLLRKHGFHGGSR